MRRDLPILIMLALFLLVLMIVGLLLAPAGQARAAEGGSRVLVTGHAGGCNDTGSFLELGMVRGRGRS